MQEYILFVKKSWNTEPAKLVCNMSLTSDKCRWDIDIRQFADDNVNLPIG